MHVNISRLIIAALWLLNVACSATPPPNPAHTAAPAVSIVPAPERPSTPAPSPALTPATNLPAITKLGATLILDDHEHHWPRDLWKTHMQYARRLVGEWGFVVVVLRIEDLNDVPKWQYFLDLCRELQLTPVIRFATFRDSVFQWWSAPIRDNEGGGYFTTAEQYRDFLDNLRWPTKQRYIIVGNEPNRGDEWGNQPNGEAYAHFLGDVSTRLRDNDPNVVILNAALDNYAPNTNGQKFSDGFRYVDADTFLQQMVKWDKDIFKKVQVWNTHAYPLGPFRAPPHEQALQFDYLNGAKSVRTAPWPSGLYNRGVNAYTWELFRIQELGGPALPVMITETGWRHRESTVADAHDSQNAEVSASQMADYFELAFIGNRRFAQYPTTGWTPWQNDPRVLAVMPFILNGDPADWGHSNWLKLDPDGTVQGVYAPYQRMLELRGSN